ncbi:sugar transferase [Cereibacter sp. SYSU M97828]|nr:sugar transferase [Cereibacter flavus]
MSGPLPDIDRPDRATALFGHVTNWGRLEMDGSSLNTAEPSTASWPATSAPRSLYRRRLKRIFDLCLIGLALPFLLPIMALIAFLVTMDGGAPLYSQIRIGAAGRPFRLWKFRTMVTDAEDALAHHLAADPAARAEWDVRQKLMSDPRVTRVGNILRRTSLDELPQVWNVLRGDMSLVGPRPMMPQQAARYPGLAYYAVRLGLTGPWQVAARNDSSFARRAEFDDAYVETLTFFRDLTLITKTMAVVLRATGH